MLTEGNSGKLGLSESRESAQNADMAVTISSFCRVEMLQSLDARQNSKSFDSDAVFLAVQAHVRHRYTDYDELLFKYDDPHLSRQRVKEKIETVLEEWRGK